MSQAIDILVENKLVKDKRGINVYHHSSRSAHLISHNSSITLPLETSEKDDYLHISLVSGPGNFWKNCVMVLPSWLDFEFVTEGKLAVTHRGGTTRLLVPPGPPNWQLKMKQPNGILSGHGRGPQSTDNMYSVIISDDNEQGCREND